MNDNYRLNAKSPRALKAKFANKLDNKLFRLLLTMLAIVGFLFWLWLTIVQNNPLGNLILTPSVLIVIFLTWYYGELKHLKPSTDISKVTDLSAILDRKLLAVMPLNVTPKKMAQVVLKQSGGYFFGSRYAIGREFVGDLSADDEGSSALVWSRSIELAKSVGAKEVDSASLMGALILSVPNAEAILNNLGLEKLDIVSGVQWYNHINKMIERAGHKNKYGGIGRDLSFGWAPVLNHVGFNITENIQRGGFLRRTVLSREQVIDQIIRQLAQHGRRNVALVGEPGTGKTTLVYSLAQTMLANPSSLPRELAYQQLISLDPATLIANAKEKGQLETLLIRIFNEALKAKNVILFLDDAQLFLRDGTGSVDLSNLLLPVLQGGALKIIISLSDQEWLRLSQENPGLAQLLNRVIVKPLDKNETIQVVEDEIILLESKNNLIYMYQSINEAYKLADRFIHEQAFPGKAIKLLEAGANFAEQKYFVTTSSIRQAVEKSYDVKVQTADSASERDTLLNLEQKIHSRMINQTRAVTLVSDALRRARSGVRNENRPIGTFLFLGPTGVGKTELSKSLASVYFGGEERLVRVDLNEYSHSEDTSRLLAVGSKDPYSLCAQIAKQPFSVVLLDEIEKAHPNVLNLLLQTLDEGVLRDSDNKPVSFRDAIIICTSNAGAEIIRSHIQAGEELEQFEDAFVDELINARVFRPEFLNRFDEVVLFRPLKKDELMQIIDILLSGLNKTLSDRKVTITLTQRAKELLAEKGYDPRLGARPLRRVMQRAVENLVAQKLLAGQITPGQQLLLDAPELHKALQDR